MAPFDDVRGKSRARLPTFDPVIDWTNEEAERSWPLFGSEGEVRVEGLDRRTARVEKEGTESRAATEGFVDAIGDSQSLDFTAMTPEQRRAARVRRRAERRAEAEVASNAAQMQKPTALEPATSASLAQPERSRDWHNPNGQRVTFSVNVCGVTPPVRARQAPWPACRVLLVGCPGGRSSPDALLHKPACASWDVERALEMAPEDAATNSLGVFSVTTDLYGPGDEFAFALVKPGCTDAQISNALKAKGGAGNGDGSESSDGFDNGGCEVRLDSGFPMGNQLTHPGSRSARCWTPADATTDIQRITGNALCESVLHGGAPGVGASPSPSSSPSSSSKNSVPSPFAARGDTCLLRRDAAYSRGKFHRVVPAFEASPGSGLGSAVKSTTQNRVSFVWGTCDEKPRSDAWCAAPTFDAARVAAACGAEYRAPKALAASAGLGTVESVRPEAKETTRASEDSSAEGKERSVPPPEPEGRSGEDENSPRAENLSSGTKSGKSDVVPNAKPTTTQTQSDSEEKAHTPQRAAAVILRSKSEPLLSDDAATRAEEALARKEAEGRAVALKAGESKSNSPSRLEMAAEVASESNGFDLFGAGRLSESAPTAVRVVAPGAWTETPATRLVFEDDAPHAVAHLLLRDGDARFASERLPWAELVVNGEVVRAPKQLARGDVVSLRVRAETEAETEERRASTIETSHTEEEPVRVATLVIGWRSGSLRARAARAD